MSKIEKILIKLLSGTSDNNFKFKDLELILESFGFDKRIKGDHHIYYRTDIPEIINIQPKGKYSKSYQVKQVRKIFINRKLTGKYDV